MWVGWTYLDMQAGVFTHMCEVPDGAGKSKGQARGWGVALPILPRSSIEV